MARRPNYYNVAEIIQHEVPRYFVGATGFSPGGCGAHAMTRTRGAGAEIVRQLAPGSGQMA